MPVSIGAELRTSRSALERVLEVDPDTVPGPDAVAAVRELTVVLRKAEVLRNRFARRVEVPGAYAGTGAKDAASWYADETKEPTGKAAAELRAARRLESMPAVAAAAAAGELSFEQADAIADAAEADPESEGELVAAAKRSSLRQTREQAERVKARARSEESEATRRDEAHRRRRLRTWVDETGAGRIDVLLAPDHLARFEACLEPFVQALLGPDAERTGRDALRADALMALAEAAASGGGRLRPTVCLHVALPAVVRGARQGEEVCELPGVGAVPVALALEWLADDALLQVVAAHGVDVTTVVTDTRRISRALDIALRHRQPRCAVAGCDNTVGLERDHITPFAQGGATSFENIQMLCAWHHGLKTRAKFVFVDGPDGLVALSPEEHAERRRAEAADGRRAETAAPGSKTPGGDRAGRTGDGATPVTKRQGRRPAAPPPAHAPPSLFDTA